MLFEMKACSTVVLTAGTLALNGTVAAPTASSAGSSGSCRGLFPSPLPPADCCSEVIEVVRVHPRDCEDPEVLGHTMLALLGLQRAGATKPEGSTGQHKAAEDTMAATGQQQNVDLSVLSLEQLNQMKTQHEEEVQTLTGNFTKLRDAQARFTESISAVESLGGKVEGKEILVPLTQSLYVPGNVVEADKMLVDVGTGYYVEKDQKKTAEFLDRKRSIVTTNLESLRNAIDVKRKNLETIVMVMRQKISEIENRRAEFKGGEEQGAVAQA